MSRGLNDFMPQGGDLGSEDHLPDRPVRKRKAKSIRPEPPSGPPSVTPPEPPPTGVKYPEITVQLIDLDGNAFAILGRVIKALKENDISKEEQDAFWKEAKAGDYDHLLDTVQQWVNVE